METKQPKFYFTRFYVGTIHEGWELSLFGLFLKWDKFLNHPQYSYMRGNNFGSIIVFSRRLEFSLPKLHNL
jgi:hypothetical protein